MSYECEEWTLILTKVHANFCLNFFQKPSVIMIDDNEWKSPINKHLSKETKESLVNKLHLKTGDVVYVAAGEGLTPVSAVYFVYFSHIDNSI